MRIDKIFFSSVMAGAILSVACAATLSTNTAPWYQEVSMIEQYQRARPANQ